MPEMLNKRRLSEGYQKSGQKDESIRNKWLGREKTGRIVDWKAISVDEENIFK